MDKIKRPLAAMILFALMFALFAAWPANAAELALDGTQSDWAVPELKEAYELGLTYPDIMKNFKSAITREEFCTIVVKLYEKLSGKTAQAVPANPFSDTNNPEILKAYNLKIVFGTAADKFSPKNNITRQEICVMIYRALEASVPNLDKKSPTAFAFSDAGKIADWALDAVKFCNKNGIMNGTSATTIDPLSKTTREQGIALLKRTYKSYAGKNYTKEMQNATLKGRVTDIYGSPISGASVTTGSSQAKTDAKGEFELERVQVVNQRSVVLFEKEGYFSLTRSGVKESDMYIEAVLSKKGNTNISLEESFNSAQGANLEVAGMKVDIPASGIMREDGTAYNGKVNADMLYLSPNNENFTEMMPGGDLAAIDSGNSEVILISWGMVNVELTDGSGNSLQLKDGSDAGVTFPIPAGMETNPPATIPLWYFDEEAGIWIEEGVATLKGNVYVGKVGHFSWHNLDQAEDIVTITGEVLCGCPPMPKPCKCDDVIPFVKVVAEGGGGMASTYTNSEGAFSLRVPANTPVTVTVSTKGGSDSQDVPGRPGGTKYKLPQPLRVPCEAEVLIRGEVICEHGKPVAYATVTGGGDSTKTNSKGEFVLRVPSNTLVTVTVTANGGSDSISVPAQPKCTTYHLPRALEVPCDEDEHKDPPGGGGGSSGGGGKGSSSGSVGTSTKLEQGSVKYAMTTSQGEDIYTSFVIATWKDYGWRFRWDMLEDRDDKKSRSASVINHFERTYFYGFRYDDEYGDLYEEYGYKYEGGGMWMDYPYNASEQSPYSFSVDENDPDLKLQGTKVYGGKLCNVYSYVHYNEQMGMTITGTIASWNGFQMFLEWESEYEGKPVKCTMVALEIATSVPDSAFTKTFDITWIG